jgi:hypothetical protein
LWLLKIDMIKYFSFFILALSAIIQASFIPLNLVLAVLVLFLTSIESIPGGLLLAFWAGLCLDLATGNTWGISSGFLLFFTFIFYLYQKRFNYQNPLFIGIYTLIAGLAYGRLVSGNPDLVGVTAIALFTALSAWFLGGLMVWGEKRGTGLRLKN